MTKTQEGKDSGRKSFSMTELQERFRMIKLQKRSRKIKIQEDKASG
jgi:hypothetical protein